MLKIRALNRESSSDEDFPQIRREAQEEIALEFYNKALRLQISGQLNEALEILYNLLNENIPLLETSGGLPSSMSTLKFSCYFNLGNIYLKKEETEKALDNYLKASELDEKDVTLWYKIGKLAVKHNRFRQAAYAFSKGLECSESHWPCLDELISVLYAIRDTISCLLYIGKAFELDSEYTKGLVIRRQIYKDNPATREYYKEYNPDYIWEPPLDVEIDEDEANAILQSEQILFDKITALEKSLGPKKLQTIPLPKALEDFTWISFGKVAIDLHQYITDNKMTHFTMVDLTKCMSQNEPAPVDVEMEPVKPDVVEPGEEQIIQEKPTEEVKKDEIIEDEKIEEKVEKENVAERRPSQNSENNNDGQENTPNQTDNDEEQNLEQDGEDVEENTEGKSEKNRNLNKSSKRKRDLISELQIWGWHSKRKSAKKGKPDRDLSVEDALNRIIPSNLLRSKVGEEKSNQMEDSMNTIDIYNMYVQNQNVSILSPIHSPKATNSEEYFGTERETDDVTKLWTKQREYCDACVLIKEFVVGLSKLWHIKWPKELIAMYIDAYNMYREHFDYPNPFNNDTPFDQMKEEALITLLYGELHSFSGLKSDTRVIHGSSLSYLQAISGWQEDWKNQFVSFFIRVYWLRSHLFRKEGHNDLAINCLELIQEIIQEQNASCKDSFFLVLPNCFKCGLISSEVVAKILKHLDMITSLNCLEDLYNAEKYKEVAVILKLTCNNSGNHPTCGKLGRPAQLAMLLHSLWYTDLEDCFIWTEEVLNEALTHFLKPGVDSDKWEKIVEKCLAFFQEIIRMETVQIIDCLSEEKRCRLVECLAKIICKQLNSDELKIPLGSITPWVLLHYILVREEHKLQASKRVSHIKTHKTSDKDEQQQQQQEGDVNGENNGEQNDELPPSVAILFSAHEFLGPKSWCLTNGGELLHFILDTVLDRLDTPIFEMLREKIDIHIEQALFCLYQHPSKKNKISRHLADHNVDPLSLTWERAFQLFDFYGPDCLPEFNSYKNASISADLEQLLQRIIALVPAEMDPQPHVAKLDDYIQGKSDELPVPINFSSKVRSIYYLIGDFYFKQREFKRCLRYFFMDLCINPNRLDSWACIGLSYLSQLENKLNYCKKLRNEMEFLDKAKRASVSFKKALELEKEHIMLWIEFGSFEYMVHSFCSRIMKYESDTLSMEKFEYLEDQKNLYLESSGQSFEKAIQLYQADESEPDERWLQYYILGKVAEKQQKEPNDYLQYYVTASKLLHENNALYPDKINYHNPQHLAVEALELHYRMNASILKYLELHEGKDIPNSIGALFKQNLDNSFFPKKNLVKEAPVPIQPKAVVNKEVEKSKYEQVDKDVKQCVNDLLDKLDEQMSEKSVAVVEKSAAVAETSAEVIVLSDSDEETKPSALPVVQTPLAAEKKILNIEETIEKMMKEDIAQKSVPMEVDQQPKTEAKSNENKVDKIKSGSETETDVRTSVDESTSSPSSSSSSSSSSESDSEDDSSSTTSTSSSATSNGNMTSGDILALVDRCIVGLEQCVIRLPQNYKAIYRLAHVYYNYKAKKDLNKCKQLLLGEYTCKGGVVITGLFSDRKNQNFFNGIWRIPSSEIDRPGSLSAHMSRCITLLLQILRATNDNKLLLDLFVHFKKTPDPDKVYIKDSERLQFAEQSMAMCIQSLRSQIQNIGQMNNEMAIHKLIHDIFRSYQRVQKNEPSKEATFAGMLTEVYRKMKVGDKIPENANVLDLATKYCQQSRVVDKIKKQTQNQAAVMARSLPSTTPPVLPTPSAITSNIQHALKRPGMGRPRGRPPLPKVPNQARSSRGRSPNIQTNSLSWIDAQSLYLKMAHDEIMKQFSQSLNLSQMNQYLAQNQMANALAQNSLAYPYLSGQASMFSGAPSNLNLLSNQLFSQLGDLSKSNPSIYNASVGTKKKSSASSAARTTTADNWALNMEALKAFGGLGQVTSAASTSKSATTSQLQKAHLPQTITSQSASITKAKSATIASPQNLPHSIANLTKPYVPKKDSVPQKASKKMYSSTITSGGGFSGFSPNLNYSTADLNKFKTKTTPSSQVFKEPTSLTTKAHSSKAADKAANLLMKERPNISITPVMQNPISFVTTASSFMPTSPGKTLQEKLADKQKQLSGKQQQISRNIEAEILSAAGIKKNINIPSISPTGVLNVTKATTVPPYKFPLESGISISQIPVTQLSSSKKQDFLSRSSVPPKPKPKELPPVSINVVRKPEIKKPPDDDDVILID